MKYPVDPILGGSRHQAMKAILAHTAKPSSWWSAWLRWIGAKLA